MAERASETPEGSGGPSKADHAVDLLTQHLSAPGAVSRLTIGRETRADAKGQPPRFYVNDGPLADSIEEAVIQWIAHVERERMRALEMDALAGMIPGLEPLPKFPSIRAATAAPMGEVRDA